MKHALSLVALVLVLAAAPLHAQGSAAGDEAAVRAAVEHYLAGHATGDGKHHSMVFHPVSNLYWVQGDSLATRTSAEYIAGSSGKPAPDEAKRKRKISMVDVTGNAAVAKVELDYPTVYFTDYFTLLKIKGEWKIMNKIFDRGTPRQ